MKIKDKKTKAVHEFKYRNNELYCEGVKIRDIVKKTGTPVYIYSHKTFVDHYAKINTAFKSIDHLVCYSMKANSNLAILKTLVSRGSGLDIVSGGELYRAKKAGCPGKKIVFAGVGKTAKEIEEALRYGILLFNVESIAELKLIDSVARKVGKIARVSLRVNPDVDAKTHKHITTGKKESKFGIDMDTARRAFLERKSFPSVSLCAIHVHIGSQIVNSDPFVRAFKKVLAFIDELEDQGVSIRYLNVGGGLGVVYNQEKPQTAEQFARRVLPLFKKRTFKVIFEPGRFIAANAGILVGEVIYLKNTRVKSFAIVDTAMNDLIRPTLYEAYHDVVPVTRKKSAKSKTYDVVGPVCESGDVLAHARSMPELHSGDLFALLSAGAYGYVMASNYNSRPKPPEVLVKGNKFSVIKPRESYEMLTDGEKVPAFALNGK